MKGLYFLLLTPFYRTDTNLLGLQQIVRYYRGHFRARKYPTK